MKLNPIALGILSLVSACDDVEVFTGTFAGSFPNATGSATKQLTEGAFSIERLL